MDKIMKIKFKDNELEKLKKILIALGKDTSKADKIAKKKGVTLKSEETLRAEVEAEAKKPAKKQGGKP